MPTLVIVGAQWGDEAKGKFVDVLGESANVIVRYSGGNNAGHTVIVGNEEFKFHLIPAGILHTHAVAILGAGMVVCPKGLLEELCAAKQKRPELGELVISPAAHVVFPYHRLLDRLEEQARGTDPIGTTSRGIGPAYQDKVARLGVRMGEFVEPNRFAARLREVLEYKNQLLALFGEPPLDYTQMLAEYREYADRLRPFVRETDPIVQEALASGKNILFEGAQGALLDLDSGTYPYVTSSHPVAGGACLGTGIGPRDIDSVLGVCKAYATRVGTGPFPTELHDDTGERIRQVGKEFGTTTGRPRRCGWLDLVALRQSARLNSLSGLIFTRLDVLSGLPVIRAATEYRLNGKSITHVPSNTWEFAEAEPVYTDFEGWEEDISGVTRREDLPGACQRYLTAIEELSGVPMALLSVGPARHQTISCRPDLVWP